MESRFITIEREYGSGGSLIAQRLSEVCNVPCYGREILEAVSKRYDMSVESLERYEETVKGSFLFTAFMVSQTISGDTERVPTENQMYIAEQNEIKQMAAGGSAVFIGHCASEALKNRKNVVKVFIRCNIEEKRKRIVSDYGIPERNADYIRKRFDNKRANYYFVNTAKKWEDPRNYDIILNSASLGIEGCVKVLKGVFDK